MGKKDKTTKFWAYVRDGEGKVHPAGFAATVEEARVLRVAKLRELEQEAQSPAGELAMEGRIQGLFEETAAPDSPVQQTTSTVTAPAARRGKR